MIEESAVAELDFCPACSDMQDELATQAALLTWVCANWGRITFLTKKDGLHRAAIKPWFGQPIYTGSTRPEALQALWEGERVEVDEPVSVGGVVL